MFDFFLPLILLTLQCFISFYGRFYAAIFNGHRHGNLPYRSLSLEAAHLG
jgi:hypothetical protein